MIHKFESIAAFARACQAMPAGRRVKATRWTDHESTDKALRYAATGNTGMVAEAEKLLEKIQAGIETLSPAWVPSVAGAYPIVPEAIMGLPQPMRTRVMEPADRSPIRVYVTITASFDVDAATIRRRGAAILALAMAVSATRPFELYAVSIAHGNNAAGESIVSCRINTTPLDLASAAYALTSAGFLRAGIYPYCEWKDDFNGQWPTGYKYGNGRAYLEKLPVKLGGAPGDLVIAPTEASDKLVNEPVAWVNDQLTKFAAQDDLAA